MIGLTLGTGLGAGVIINSKLYAGYNCGAGEFGLFRLSGQCTGILLQRIFFSKCISAGWRTGF